MRSTKRRKATDMSKRPLIGKTVGELEDMFKASQSDLHALESLASELTHRKRARATELLDNVRRALSDPSMALARAGLRLFEDPPKAATESSAPNVGSASARINRLTIENRPRPEPMKRSEAMLPFPDGGISVSATSPIQETVPTLAMTVEDACGILHVSLGASWEAIETARQEIVMGWHPDRVKGFDSEKRRSVQENARSANLAAQVIFSSRISSAVARPADLQSAENENGLLSHALDTSAKRGPATVSPREPIAINARFARS